MKKLNYVKVILDTLMAVVFTLLLNKMVLGLAFHEVAGLLIGAVVLLHCALNWRWIKGVTLKLFDRKMSTKTRIGYLIDLLLLISFVIIIISGISISKIVFPGLGGYTYTHLHMTVAYLSLILIGIHIGLHWNWVMNMFIKSVKLPQKKIFGYLSKVAVIFVLAFGIYSANSVGFLSKISFWSSQANSGAAIHQSAQISETADSKNQATGSSQNQHQPPTDGSSKNQHQSPVAQSISISNVLGVITSYLGVISIFSILTVYIEKLLNIKRKKTIKC